MRERAFRSCIYQTADGSQVNVSSLYRNSAKREGEWRRRYFRPL